MYKKMRDMRNGGQRMKAIDRARKSVERSGKKAKTESDKKWNREYYKDRYHNDSKFRMKVIRANSGGCFKEGED